MKPQAPLTRQDLPALTATIRICEADATYASQLGDTKTAHTMRNAAARLQSIYVRLSGARPQGTMPNSEATPRRTYHALGFDMDLPQDGDAQPRKQQRKASDSTTQDTRTSEPTAQPQDADGEGEDKPRPTREEVEQMLPPVDSKGCPPVHDSVPIGMPDYD